MRLGEPPTTEPACAPGSTATRACASSSTRRPTGRRADRRARGDRRASTRSTSRAPTRARWSTSAPDPALYRRIADGLPRRLARGSRPDARDRGRARAPPRPHHLGRADPLGRRHRGAAAGRRARSTSSRRASARSSALFAAYDYCEERGIGAYGGGQFELGVGRGQIQLLAALFHPDTPNDVAPGGYNARSASRARRRARCGSSRAQPASRPPPLIDPEPAPSASPSEASRSSTDTSGSDSIFELPRAPSATETRAIVRSSGASTTLTKS